MRAPFGILSASVRSQRASGARTAYVADVRGGFRRRFPARSDIALRLSRSRQRRADGDPEQRVERDPGDEPDRIPDTGRDEQEEERDRTRLRGDATRS